MAAIANIESVRIFAQHRDEVYRWAHRLVGRHHDALDVAQDVCVKWAAAARDSPPIDNPRAWLRRVTINRAIDAVRARTTAMAASIDAAVPCTASAGVDALEREELRRDVALALEPLTDMQRSVLIAKTYEGLTFAEIAVDLGVAVPTVKTHYLRAVSAVRDRLVRCEGQERV